MQPMRRTAVTASPFNQRSSSVKDDKHVQDEPEAEFLRKYPLNLVLSNLTGFTGKEAYTSKIDGIKRPIASAGKSEAAGDAKPKFE